MKGGLAAAKRTLWRKSRVPDDSLPDAQVMVAVEPPVSPASSTALLRFAYVEILDATKHQDDKINRLLTTVAFLTAAALALANLSGAVPLATAYNVGDSEVPLPQILLGVFLVGVVATVIMLITSLTTPLRFPGAAGGNERFKYAPAGAQVSQFYFHEIAKSPLNDWEAKWNQEPAVLEDEQRRLLVRETHNLALRTEYKYARTNEAVAVLSFSLLSFVLAAVMVLMALAPGAPSGPQTAVSRSASPRIVLGAVLLGYSLLTVLASVRSATQSVTQLASVRFRKNNFGRATARLLFAFGASSFPAVLIWLDPGIDSAVPRLGFVVPPLVTGLCLWYFLRKELGTDSDADIGKSLFFWGWIVLGGQGVIATLLAVIGHLAEEPYLWQLVGAFGSALLLMVATLARSGIEQRWRVEKHLKSHPAE